MASVVSMKQLLEAGVHFGHQTRRWNPKMAPYIFTERNGIYIIDLQKTVKKLEEAYNFVREISADGKSVLFVGTKKQAQDSVKEEALRAGAYYVNARWLGGMLTNFTTIKRRIQRLTQLRTMESDGTFDLLPKKEVIKLNLEIEKLEKFLGGIKEMKELPGALFIVDPRKERIAVAEAKKLGGSIKVVDVIRYERGEGVEKKEESKSEEKKPVAEPKKEEKSEAKAESTSKYDSDPRVRTGAYRIVGVANTVTVKSGQTLKAISKTYLGAGMECYVEVFNGGITEVKEGQTIKIPKLELKKKGTKAKK